MAGSDDIARTADAAGALVELTCERMAYGPEAIARDAAGRTVFVSGAVAGDRVLARVDEVSASFSRATVEQLLEAGADRIDTLADPALAAACPWAALSRPAQLAAKRSCVVDSLVRIGRFDAGRAEELVAACEQAGPDWGYRNKVELSVVRDGSRTLIGMVGADGRCIKTDGAALLPKRFAKAAKSAAGAVGYLLGKDELGIRRIALRASERTGELELALWGSPGAFPRAHAAKVLADACSPSSLVRVLTKGPEKARRVTGVERLSGAGSWGERIGEEQMRVSAPSFFQVNTAGAERLVELVLEGLAPTEDDVAMDLYCGAGTFTLPLARRCDYVQAVEAAGSAVRDLRRNLEQAGLDNVWAEGGDAGREFPEDPADIIVVDPPRAGLAADVVGLLSEQPARAIAYVSCDPATLARDLARFEADGRWRVARISPVDLFPQTYHVECVTILERA